MLNSHLNTFHQLATRSSAMDANCKHVHIVHRKLFAEMEIRACDAMFRNGNENSSLVGFIIWLSKVEMD